MADILNKYCIYVGSSRGTIQKTFCLPNEKLTYIAPEKSSAISAFNWGRIEDEILVGFEYGHVSLYNPNLNKYIRTINDLEGSGAVVGLAAVNKSLIIGRHDGIITIWKKKCSDYFSINLDEQGTLDCMTYHTNRQNIVGTGGEFNDFKLWDIVTKQCVFKAKSMGHDELNLPISTSVRGIAFISDSEHFSVCCTKQGHILAYDDRSQRRPVIKFLEKKACYSCISSAYRDKQCLVGTTKGYMQLLDMKMPGKCLKTFIDFTGSVTCICCDALEPYVASTSLDRHLRVHNLETKELIHKAYLKQNLTKILMKPAIKTEIEKKEEQVFAEIDEEYEELFNNMEVIEDDKKRKTEKCLKKKKKMKKSMI